MYTVSKYTKNKNNQDKKHFCVLLVLYIEEYRQDSFSSFCQFYSYQPSVSQVKLE